MHHRFNQSKEERSSRRGKDLRPRLLIDHPDTGVDNLSSGNDSVTPHSSSQSVYDRYAVGFDF